MKYNKVYSARRIQKKDVGAKMNSHLVNHWLVVNTHRAVKVDADRRKQSDEITFGETKYAKHISEPHMYLKCKTTQAYEARKLLCDFLKHCQDRARKEKDLKSRQEALHGLVEKATDTLSFENQSNITVESRPSTRRRTRELQSPDNAMNSIEPLVSLLLLPKLS